MTSCSGILRRGVVGLIVALSCSAQAQLVPEQLPGVEVVDALRLQALQHTVRIIDTRPLHDYLAGRIPGALHIHYREHSARTVHYDPHQDDVPRFLHRLQRQVPARQTGIVFYCNGEHCWKSYKAARAAMSDGYRHLFWFRGGIAEWERLNLPRESE